MLSEADLIAKRAALRWLAQQHPVYGLARHEEGNPYKTLGCGDYVPSQAYSGNPLT
jgi:hypothetical protein